MKNIVLYSGGIGSFLAAYLVKQKYSNDDTILYFNDTKMEDEDLYRFLHESAKLLDCTLIKDSDGRDVWQVFKDCKYVANNRIDVCSRILKRERARTYVNRFKPNEIRVVIGIDWTEIHRFERAVDRWKPYNLYAPLCDTFETKEQLTIQAMNMLGKIDLPRLYKLGFPHNNCGGFCVKAGLAQFRLLLEKMPERYLELEKKELETYEAIGKRNPWLRKTVKGTTYYITMREYRIFLETKKLYVDGDLVLGAKSTNEDREDWGGCGCAI